MRKHQPVAPAWPRQRFDKLPLFENVPLRRVLGRVRDDASTLSSIRENTDFPKRIV